MDFNQLLEKAGSVYSENFPPTTWFGRCIFLSWYCDVGTCKFCFRSTIKHRIRHAKSAKRDVAGILADAIIGKNMGWRVEFLTGGYRIFSFEEMLEICRLVSSVYNEKIWINLGTITREQLEQLRPYVEGVCASIECINPSLHEHICPDKPIEPYSDMLKTAREMGFKTSATIVIGLGETKDDFESLAGFISSHSLDRITFYALKPVAGTPYTKSPDPEEYAWWIAQTRIRFPKLEIMAGLTPKKAEEYAGLILRAGANALTKFPAVKRFGSLQAAEIEKQAASAGREFRGSLTVMPDADWEAAVSALPADDTLKSRVRKKLAEYTSLMTQSSLDNSNK
ncbi:radical SAM protein [Candidatus Woesearchaeota archaeon]|nr:radical SAM protein [Candidatus Woesearchaeota archaeon]